MTHFEPINEEQWEQLAHLFPEPAKRGRGKPHASWRNVVNSILFVLLSNLKWSSIPNGPDFATKSVSHRWFSIWDKSGFLAELINAYKAAMHQESKVTYPPRRQRLPKPTPHLQELRVACAH